MAQFYIHCIYLLLITLISLPPKLNCQLSVTNVGSFNNVGGKSFERVAVVSESAIVGKQGIVISTVEPSFGTATGGTHVHIRGDGFATDTYGGSNKVRVLKRDNLAGYTLPLPLRTPSHGSQPPPPPPPLGFPVPEERQYDNRPLH